MSTPDLLWTALQVAFGLVVVGTALRTLTSAAAHPRWRLGLHALGLYAGCLILLNVALQMFDVAGHAFVLIGVR